MKKLVGKFCSIVKEIDNSPILVGWIEELREENEKLQKENEKLKQEVKDLEIDLEGWRNGIYAELML